MTKYIKVEQPEYQFFMDHPRFDECCYLVEDNSYMIPEDIYEKFYKPMKKIVILTGSGVSAESGIPTFRGAADSLWEGVKCYGSMQCWLPQRRMRKIPTPSIIC